VSLSRTTFLISPILPLNFNIERLKSRTFLFISIDFSDKIWYNIGQLDRSLTKALRRGKFRPDIQVKSVSECSNQRLPNLTSNYLIHEMEYLEFIQTAGSILYAKRSSLPSMCAYLLPCRGLYAINSTKDYVRIYKLFMQKKPNFLYFSP